MQHEFYDVPDIAANKAAILGKLLSSLQAVAKVGNEIKRGTPAGSCPKF